MTTLIPALERELLQAAELVISARSQSGAATSRAASTRPSLVVRIVRSSGGRWRAQRRGAVLAMLLGTSLTVTAGAYASRGLWLPELGADSYGHAKATASPPPSSELSVLGVLRREQTPADQDVAVRTALRDAGPDMKVRTNAVRHMGALPDGRVLVLVPSRLRPGFDPTLPHETQDQLVIGLYDPVTGKTGGFITSDALGMRAGNLMFPASPRVSAGQAARGRAFLEHEVSAGRLTRTAGPPFYHVMTVEQTDRYERAMGIPADHPVTWTGVVPDGVAQVRVGKGRAVPVSGNFFAAAGTSASREPVVWLDAKGNVVPFASTLGAWK